MADFFTAKISQSLTVSTSPTQKSMEELPPQKTITTIIVQSAIIIDDSLPEIKINELQKPFQSSQREAKQSIKEMKKDIQIILIEDDDEDRNSTTKLNTVKAIATNSIQKDLNRQLEIDNKRSAQVDIDDLIPDIAEVQKKVKLDDQQANLNSDQTELESLNNLMSPYIPVRGTQPELTPVVAVDCEMVLVEGNIHELARCSIVDYNGHVLFDKLIMPKGRITNYLTYVSGITAHKLKDAKPYSEYKSEIINILKERIIVGHSIKNDFVALNYQPEKKYVRDIVQYKGYKVKGGTISLKKMTANHLGWQIQEGQHNSVIDARATLALYRRVEKEWEKEISDADYGMVRTVRLSDIKKSSAAVV